MTKSARASSTLSWAFSLANARCARSSCSDRKYYRTCMRFERNGTAVHSKGVTPNLSTVRNALRILDTFSEREPILGVMELSRRLKISKSAVSRLVTTLCSQGILTLAPSGHYRLGARLY